MIGLNARAELDRVDFAAVAREHLAATPAGSSLLERFRKGVVRALVSTRALGLQPAGSHSHLFDGRELDSGLYLYRLRVLDPQAAVTKPTLTGKLMLTR